MAFVIAGAARLTYSSVRAAIDAHHDVAHGLEPKERFDRWGDKKDQHPVYDFVRRTEQKWRDRKGKGRASASNRSDSSVAVSEERGEEPSHADHRSEMTMVKKDEPVAVTRPGESAGQPSEEDLPVYDADSTTTPLGLPSPAYTGTRSEMPILPTPPVHEPSKTHAVRESSEDNSARRHSERSLLEA